MSDILPAITANLFGSQIQTREPQARYSQDPCSPNSPPTLGANLTVLYPKTANNAIPAMGGSIIKISFSSLEKSDKYNNYVRKLNNELDNVISSKITQFESKNTSAIRAAINVFLIDSISTSSIIDIAPSLYFSSTVANKEDIEPNREYPEAIIKKSKFSFLPMETIRALLLSIATKTDDDAKIISSTIGGWSGISGSTFYELYKILDVESGKENSISEDNIVKIIMEILPFFNISESEMLNDTVKPSLCGYFTVIGDNIYLKMPDFSGFDSAGYGSDYLENSSLNLLFQLIFAGKEKNTYSIKNIFIENQNPIFANITDSISEYDLKTSGEFSFKFSSDVKPEAIYLSPAIPGNVAIKDAGFLGIGSIAAEQSGSFIEFNNFPNPFVSIFDNSIQMVNTSRKLITCKRVDQPYIKTNIISLKKIQEKFEKKYNNSQGNRGVFWPYINQIYSDVEIFKEELFKIGFPFEQEFFEKNGGVLSQTLTTYEYVGSLSRQNTILHRGVEADTALEEYSGFKQNNKKYFKKEFISNSTGLCENHRPRVFTSPKEFIPSTWIKSSNISSLEGDEYKASFRKSDILKFYAESATDLKFVVYAYDGKHQVSKVQNGYISVQKDSPEILSISPNGTRVDSKIISCSDTTIDTATETNRLTITTPSAQSVDSILIKGSTASESLNIQKNDSWVVSGTTITISIPCNQLITSGETIIKLVTNNIESAPVKIYIANGYSVVDRIVNISDLPLEVSGAGDLTAEEVLPENMFIKSISSGIPISYSDFKSKIKIKSKKKAFKESRDIYLYLAFDNKEIAKKLSNSIVDSTATDGSHIYIAKDFSYKLSNSLDSDFYRENNKNASLYFPGNSHSQKALSILTSEVQKAYFVISSDDETTFSGTGNIATLRVGTDKERAFIPPPLIIGMAATYSDTQKINHFNNFQKTSIYKQIADKILKSEISEIENIESLVVKHKIEKIVVLFKYRDIVKFKRRDFSLYIKNEKIGGFFSQHGVKRASDLDGLTDAELVSSKDLYYFIAKDIDITTDKSPGVRVDIYDRDFKVNNSTRNKYSDISIRVPSGKISQSTNPESGSVFINANDIIISGTKDSYGNSFSGSQYLFGSYESELALSGFFASGVKNDLINFTGYPSVVVRSSLSGKLSAVKNPGEKDTVIQLLKDVQSDDLINLPYFYFSVSNGSEVYSGEYLEGESEYLIFARVQIDDICRLSVLQPEILKVSKTNLVVPGDRVILTVKNMLPYSKVEVLGKKAKIEDVKKVALNTHEVKIVIPDNITAVATDPCDNYNIVLYNGNQILNKGELDLGYRLSEELNALAAGLLSYGTNQFDKFKEKYIDGPLRFISSILDANVIKDFLTNFCNLSFHITADLNLSLQGFKQLLIPIKVIFCIIDVICNLFNPFQLPLAIIRLFECLYDLVLLLPQISIPVMFFSLLIHILDLLECVIVKILNFIVIINLTIDAIATILASDKISFRELMVLEEMLTKYVISLEADLDVMTPIVQILSIFMQLLQITFRFPCSVGPNSNDAPCGITGFDVGAMVSGLIATPSGSAPSIKYNFETKYMIPVCQPFTKSPSETVSPPSYSSSGTIEPARTPVETVFPESTYVNENYFEKNYFNQETLRKKQISYSPDTDALNDISTDTYVSLSASYTKRVKILSSIQTVMFKFSERTWKSGFPIFDSQIIDEKKGFDTPISLLTKDGNSLKTTIVGNAGNFYSQLDGKSLVKVTADSDGNYYGTVNPLKLNISQNGVEVERTFDTIPAMVILDEEFNTYYIEDGGIIFGTYEQLDGATVVGVKEIRATVINQTSSKPESFSKEDEVTGEDSDGNPIVKDIFNLPQLYFVDTRVAAEAIQSKCETASINQLPLDIGDGTGGSDSIEKVTKCIGDFLSSVKNQTSSIKNSLSVGSLPDKLSKDTIESAYINLVDCVKESIDDVCSLVVNPLNTSFRLLDDNEFNRILPDTSLPDTTLAGFESDGPPLTGAREFAAGIGDAANISVGGIASILLIPRDSYDNIITYNISDKINIEIISDSTQSAELVLYPTTTNNQNYLVYNSSDGSYTAKITSSNIGEVKIKASICKKYVEAITYSDISSQIESAEDNVVGCVPESITIQPNDNSIPLGALSRISRVLTINFVKETVTNGIGSDSPGLDSSENILSNPQEFGTGMEN